MCPRVVNAELVNSARPCLCESIFECYSPLGIDMCRLTRGMDVITLARKYAPWCAPFWREARSATRGWHRPLLHFAMPALARGCLAVLRRPSRTLSLLRLLLPGAPASNRSFHPASFRLDASSSSAPPPLPNVTSAAARARRPGKSRTPPKNRGRAPLPPLVEADLDETFVRGAPSGGHHR